jgi:hypothetical protein
VPDWDVAFMQTEGRETINPRPRDQTNIFRIYQREAVGFITYSEGCNDDVNKIVWSSLGWNPEADTLEILREYSRYFIGETYAGEYAQALLALERNWRGPLLANGNVETTLLQFQAMERTAPPHLLLNWRFQQGLYRAYYDAYVRSRLIYETDLEARALHKLRGAGSIGALPAVAEAAAILDRAASAPPAPDLRKRVFELAEALYQSIRMQLSVERYKAISVDRGANLDTLDVPLNNRPWLTARFAEIQSMPGEKERLDAIDTIVNWTNPGPGGFYDDLGDPARQPHLVRGLGFDRDPAHLQSSLVGYGGGRSSAALHRAWRSHAESLVDAPLSMRYEGLDPKAEYKVRVVYGGDSPRVRIRLFADDRMEIHPLRAKDAPIRPVEFDVPPEATRDGQLTLTWRREEGLGGNGRGCQVSEVWLVKK